MEPWKKNLSFIWIAHVLALIGFTGMGPIIPFYIQDLGVSDPAQVKVWVGSIATAGAVAFAIVSPVWGRVADAYGRRAMVIRAYCGDMLMMILLGLATHPWQLVLFRGLGGLFAGSATASLALVATTTPPKESGSSLGFLHSARFIGGMVGPMIGGLMADTFGFRPTFFFIAGTQAASVLISLFLVKENFRRRPVQGKFWRNLLPDFRMLTRSKDLLVLLSIVGAVQMSYSVVLPILPLFIQSIAVNTARISSTTGLILGLQAAAGILGAILLGRAGDRVGTTRILIVCLLGEAVAYFPLMWVQTPAQLLLLRIAGGFFIGGTIPTLNALISRKVDPSLQGTVYGMRGTIASGGMSIGPMIGAGLAVAWGYSAVFLFLTIFLTIVTGLIAVAERGKNTE